MNNWVQTSTDKCQGRSGACRRQDTGHVLILLRKSRISVYNTLTLTKKLSNLVFQLDIFVGVSYMYDTVLEMWSMRPLTRKSILCTFCCCILTRAHSDVFTFYLGADRKNSGERLEQLTRTFAPSHTAPPENFSLMCRIQGKSESSISQLLFTHVLIYSWISRHLFKGSRCWGIKTYKIPFNVAPKISCINYLH